MNTKTKVMLRGSISIIGLGYVGTPLAVLAKKRGYKVTGIDINTKKVDLINSGKLPFKDNKLQQELSKHAFVATTDFSKIVDSSVIVICVPTPVKKDRQPDLTPVISACESIGKYLRKDQLVVLESTVNPGVCDEVVIPTLERVSGLKAGRDFSVAHCPERINPGDTKWVLEDISRVVGGLDDTSRDKAYKFYTSILNAPVTPMASLKEAEAVKIVENCFRDINIAFVNELAQSFSRLGIDTVRVINAAATKPFSFLPHYPGCGVGGHCIPVDPYYLIDYAHRHGFEHRLLKLARNINSSMPAYTVGLLSQKIVPNNGSAPVAVLGLAYKPNIDDCRESPADEIIALLQQEGYSLRIFDPYVPDKSTVSSLNEAVEGASAVVIATGHNEFRQLDPTFFQEHRVQLVIDGVNCLDKNLFSNSAVSYVGIGR